MISLVRPRPHAVPHNEEHTALIGQYYARHRIQPGITGYTQISGLRGETDTPEKIAARVEHNLYSTCR